MAESLQQFAIWRGRGHRYYAATSGLSLSLKSVSNGQARYRVDGREIVIDDAGYLIVNERQPYSIEIASVTEAETFILWFPSGWAEEVQRSVTSAADDLLGEPERAGSSCEFFNTYTPHDGVVSPRVHELRTAHRRGEKMEENWLEERLRGVLAAMLQTRSEIQKQIANVSAVRAATREELWKRINRARDFLHARCTDAISLSDAARVACLSPFHFLRTFRASFGCTPHEYLTRCRIERAQFLLSRTELPLTEVALDSGFVTPSAFSSTFRKMIGVSPREWRETHRQRVPQNSKIRKVFLSARA